MSMPAAKRSRRAPARPRKIRRISRKRTSVPRALRQNHTYITRMVHYNDFAIPLNGTWTYTSMTFKLSDLVNYTEFTSLFNEYKIAAVKVTFLPRWTNNDVANSVLTGTGAAFGSNPLIWTMADRDGTTTISSQSNVMQNSRARMVRHPFRPFSVYVRPKVQVEVANDPLGVTYASAMPRMGWLDTQNANIQHSGVQIAGYIPYSASAASGINVTFDVFAKFYMQFKDCI